MAALATSREDIQRYFEYGVSHGATHLMVVCDQFDWEDYPVYVKPEENVREKYAEYNAKDMQHVMEVYNLSMDMTAQLNEHRAFNF